ncbi:MAG: hypothetical protein FJ335_10365, partial [Sphingomonadales bacterium]|nr:hypothetical protein [Sphingomonadales bacterium]
MKLIATAAVLASIALPATAQQTHTTVTRTTRPGVVVTTQTGGYPAYAVPLPQDGPYLPYEPLPSDAEVFGGLRVEVQAGYDRLSGDIVTKDGVTYGGEAGF